MPTSAADSSCFSTRGRPRFLSSPSGDVSVLVRFRLLEDGSIVAVAVAVLDGMVNEKMWMAVQSGYLGRSAVEVI